MASVEAGASVLTGGSTSSQIYPAGDGYTPTSAYTISQVNFSSTNINQEEYGNTALVNGSTSSGIYPAGSGLTPTSTHTLSQGAMNSMRPDTGEYGVTELAITFGSVAAQAARTTRFKMCAHDASNNYDTWIVIGAPDYTGSQYRGSLSVLIDISVCG